MKMDIGCVYENGEDIKIANYAEDDNSLFICANHQNILFYKNQQQNPLQIIKAEKSITAIRYGLEAIDLYAGTQNGLLQIWDVNKLTKTQIEGHQDEIAVIKNIDENNFISGANDKKIHINDKSKTKPALIIDGHEKEINDILIHSDKVRIISASQDKTIKIWDQRKSNQPILTIDVPLIPKKLELIEDSSILIACEDQSIHLQNLDNIQQKISVEQNNLIHSIKYHQVQNSIVCATDLSLEIFDVNLQLVNSLQYDWNVVYDITYDENQLKLLIQSSDNKIQELYYSADKQQENLENNDSTPFSQLMKFDQCFYPALQQQENLAESQHYSEEDFERFETKNDIVMTQQFSLSFSALFNNKETKERFQQLEIIQEINQNHSKFSFLLRERIQKLEPILNHYQNNELKLCINLIYKQTDLNVIQNSLFLLRNQKSIKLKEDEFVILIAKSMLLINSKYSHQVIEGLEFLKFSFESVKNFLTQNAKPQKQQQKQQDKFLQKPKTVDKLLYQFDKILQQSCLDKILKDKKQDNYAVQLTKQIKNQIGTFLNKLQ